MSCTSLPSHSDCSNDRPAAWAKPSAAGWLLIVGLALRLVHYLWNHSIWYDEASLLINILDKDYGQLLGPLEYEQAAPPLFLWGLRALFELCGDYSYVWRFPPFLISCLTLIFTAALARRVLPAIPAVLLVGLVAFSDAFVWLGCNVKPYILDAFLATGILYAWVATEQWTPVRRMLLYTFAAPFLLCASYPMLYLYAGVFLAFLPIGWRRRRIDHSWAAYLGMIAVVLVTLGCLYLGPIHAQRVPGLVNCWTNKMPNLSKPASIPGWTIGNTFLVFHYCFNPIGTVCTLFVGAGAWWCLNNRRLDWVCLCLGPAGACLCAAFLQVYPFSSNRLILFTAPGIGLMTGLGAAVVLNRWRGHARLATAGLVALLILPEAVVCVKRIHSPWDYPDSSSVAQFVRQRRQPDELVASDDQSYIYAFHGEALSLDEAAHTPYHDGQRVWVLKEHYTPEKRRDCILAKLRPGGWELRSEVVFYRISVLMLVRHTEGNAAQRADNRQ